jgi:hypothetical protein
VAKKTALREQLILKELLARNGAGQTDVLEGAFDKQREFISDPSNFKAALCTRRAGKSYTAGLYLYKEALENPGVSLLYVALTRDSAKRIMWKDVLKHLNRKLGMKVKFNETSLTATFGNGSVIYLVGADSDEEEKEKLLGQKYKLVIIDEAASYSIDLRDLVYKTLKPAVADYRGTICLIGTPGNLLKSLYFDVTRGAEPGWSVHSWTTFDNPEMASKWEAEIEDLKKTNPLVVETPWFQQMYLGLWVIDSSQLVYRFNAERNLFKQLPANPQPYRYVLGIDLGYNDDTAFVVCCYQKHNPTLFVVRTIKKPHLDITDVATQIKALDKEFKFDVLVTDGANKQAVAELNNRHNVNLVAADKTGKNDFIELMNSDLIQGKIKASAIGAGALVQEWSQLIWKETESKRIEHPSLPNHLADAALYAWRHCYQYLWQPEITRPNTGSPEWIAEEVARMEADAEQRYQRSRAKEQAEDLWLDISADDDLVGW